MNNKYLWTIIFLILMGFLLYFLYLLNQNFLQCPNKDMLLWDANIRMIQSIDILQYIKIQEYTLAIKTLLDSPTWPPLRSFISILLILINGKPDPVLDTRVSIVFFLLTIATIYWGFLYLFYEDYKKNLINKILIFLILFTSIGFLLLLDQIPEYLFNSMLEIQGMFFYTLFIFLLYNIYKTNIINTKKKIIFFIIGLFIYFTKYPYGILISISLIAIEFISNPFYFLQEVKKFISLYKNYRILFLLLPVFSFILILLFPYLKWSFLKTKMIKNLMYFFIIIAFVEFNIFNYKNKIQLFSEKLRFFYIYFILPFCIVILSHPDRFHSLLGAQSDTIDKGRSFFISIFYDYFLNSSGFFIIIITSLLVLVYIFYKNHNNISKTIEHNPAIKILIFLWIHFLILEFLTTNHQARYIFQIIPGLLLFHGTIFLIFLDKFKIYFIFIFFIMFFINVIYIFSTIDNRNTCFSGMDKNLFEPVRKIFLLIPEDTRGLIFNEFHEYKKYGHHLDNPYIFIPTDIDVYIRYKVYPEGYAFNYSYYQDFHKLKWNTLIYINVDCNQELKNSQYWKFNFDVSTYNKVQKFLIHSGICLQMYQKDQG